MSLLGLFLCLSYSVTSISSGRHFHCTNEPVIAPGRISFRFLTSTVLIQFGIKMSGLFMPTLLVESSILANHSSNSSGRSSNAAPFHTILVLIMKTVITQMTGGIQKSAISHTLGYAVRMCITHIVLLSAAIVSFVYFVITVSSART